MSLTNKINKDLLNAKYFKLIILITSFIVLFSIPIIQKDTPFRAEHWALLYVYSMSNSFTEFLFNIANFVCFGDNRFQPLAFFVPSLSYSIFKLSFFFHYVVSVILHIILVIRVLNLLHLLREGTFKKKEPLFFLYPIESALLLVLFCCVDVITWTFFQYVQVATILSSYSLYYYIKKIYENQFRNSINSYLLILLSSLIYECYISLFTLYVIVDGVYFFSRKRRTGIDFLVSLITLLIFSSIYLTKYFVYSKQARSLWDWLYYLPSMGARFVNFLATILSSIFLPSTAKVNKIFELPMVSFISSRTYLAWILIVFVIFILITFFNVQKQKFNHLQKLTFFMCIGVICGVFFSIGMAKFKELDYSVVQFRYCYSIIPFFFSVFLFLIYSLIPIKIRCIYSIVLFILIGINSWSTINFNYTLRRNIKELTDYVNVLKASGNSSTRIVFNLVEAISERKIKTSKSTEIFIYNAASCSIDWLNYFNKRSHSSK